MAHDILLEAGTNEMELLTFELDGIPFGVNVAKIREIIEMPKVINLPQSPHVVEGSFLLRDNVLTLVNLGKHFGLERQAVDFINEEGVEDDGQASQVIIVEFNNVRCGVMVDDVHLIRRISWQQLDAPSAFLANIDAPITGTVNFDEGTVLVLDFETILAEILDIPSPDLPTKVTEKLLGDEKDIRILLADDSSIVRETLTIYLAQAGFTNFKTFNNGGELMGYLESSDEHDQNVCDLVITDIEMPVMDGLYLTRKIKENSRFKHLPVMLLSSLITDDNRNKGIAVGADSQIKKSDGAMIVKEIKRLVGVAQGVA